LETSSVKTNKWSRQSIWKITTTKYPKQPHKATAVTEHLFDTSCHQTAGLFLRL